MSPLKWARKLGRRFFLQFGLHCATHQIRVILISCVVITSLFYPALDVYVSSKNSSLAILDGFISTDTAAGITTPNDLVNLWSGHDALHIHEDPIIHAQCREGHALRVERILIQSPPVDDNRALHHRILLSTLHLQQLLENLVSTGDTPCLKEPNGQCFVISPLAFWGYNKDTLLSDVNILDTLSYSENISIAGVPVTPHMVLAGRRSYEHPVTGNRLDYPTFLALTYFFPKSACWASEPQHARWVRTVQKKAEAQNADVIVQPPEASPIALEYELHLSEGWSAISAFLYLAYICFFVYVAWSVRRMDAVHSRLGVTFTALVELSVSTITSLSVCALVGFKITMVPWELLPIVIAFVGAENMFNLVDAVGKTSVTLSVKQRIAEGLSLAGTSNTLKVVSYNAILGIIAVFTVGAVRQFCIFAIVVLVAHWFLAHTFFMAVLSIDIARLELEQLLRHDTSLIPSVPTVPKDGQNLKKPRSKWQNLIVTTQNLLKGRAATNISLLMLLAIAATLYYTTYTASTLPSNPNLIKSVGAASRAKGRPSFDVSSTAGQIWEIMNPAQTPLLHLRVEMPTIITFHPDGESTTTQSSYRSRFTMRTFKFVLWVLTIMVLPIAATTSALWGLLIYLLKNTELLEAQRNRPETEASAKTQDNEKGLEGQISFSTLPRAFASDVELIAASKDGRVIISVGLHNEITIWNTETKKHMAIDASDVLLGMASTSSCAASTVMCVTVDDRGRHFAVGTGSGLIAVWSIDPSSGIVKLLPVLSLENSSTAVTEMYFVPSSPFKLKRTPGRTRSTSEPDATSEGTILLTTYQNGVATRWSVSDSTFSYFAPSRGAAVIQSSLLHVIPDNRVLIAFCLDDGSVDVVETGDFEPTILQDCCIRPGNGLDVVWKLHACRAEMNGSVRFVIIAATEAGSVSLWDGVTGECISVLEETHGRINHLRISPVKCEICHFCGQLPMESLSVAFSVDHVIRFSKLYLNDHSRCSCTRNHPLQQQRQQSSHLRRVSSRESLLGRRSRSNSNASSTQVSTLSPRARLATAFETSAFPVSGHGVHSRRASEKDTGRRSSELLTVPFPGSSPGKEYELQSSNGHRHDHNGSTTPTNERQSIWVNAIMVHLIDITCERGGWDLMRRKFVGIRRKPRSQGKSKAETTWTVVSPSSSSSHGLTSVTLERWELWTFDPALANLRSSLLAALTLRPGDGEGRSSSSSHSPPSTSSSSGTTLTSSSTSPPGECIARLPFTRVSPLLVAPSHALAGFGNTIGVFHFSS